MPKLPHPLLLPLGGLIYGLLEVLWRGYTHWTMVLLGGLCFYLLAVIGRYSRLPLHLTAVPCAYVITGLELLCGCVVNLGLGWNVWDYSQQPLNLWGQICFPFLGYWYLLSLIALPFSRVLLQQLQK